MSGPRNERLFGVKWSERARPGVLEVSEFSPEWVAEQSQSVWVIDVREREELLGPLGHVPGSAWVALEQVAVDRGEAGVSAPVVLVSRSGRRAARAALYLQELGMRYVAILAGGMLAWKAAGFAATAMSASSRRSRSGFVRGGCDRAHDPGAHPGARGRSQPGAVGAAHRPAHQWQALVRGWPG